MLRSGRPLVIMVNCANHRVITNAIDRLLAVGTSIPLGAYANMGSPEGEEGWRFTDELSPQHYADVAATWVERGVRVVGGCCGTTPAHIRELANVFKNPIDLHEPH
jgi:methionine synthase / methylenetetrahydrofolate reductase (NADH)